jgi:hypothetical protein
VAKQKLYNAVQHGTFRALTPTAAGALGILLIITYVATATVQLHCCIMRMPHGGFGSETAVSK